MMEETDLAAPSHFRRGGLGESAVGVSSTDRFPVENISRDDCDRFVHRATRYGLVRGWARRGSLALPTEEEWEYACRGGTPSKPAFHFGSILNGLHANCDGNYPYGTDESGPYLARTSPVGDYESQARHPWGLCDLHGNVWEWCAGLDRESQIFAPLRGGSYDSGVVNCRTAYRRWSEPNVRLNRFGLRLCLRPS